MSTIPTKPPLREAWRLAEDHPIADNPEHTCFWCDNIFNGGDLINFDLPTPAGEEDERKALAGRAHNVEVKVVHEQCRIAHDQAR
jgi:hypothetical protein